MRFSGAVIAVSLSVASSTAIAENVAGGGQLEEIIVTAQKRAERLQDVPSAVSVLGAQRMLESHQTQLIDYAATIPGLQVDAGGGPGQSSLTMRGLSLGGAGATVGTYIDDVPIGSSAGSQNAANLALDLLPYDIERIEVLRGPQGTYYGANALGGLLKYVTKEPKLSEEQWLVGADMLNIEGGGGLGYTVRVGGNAPVIDDKLAVRASYARDHVPGYIDVPAMNRQHVNESTRQTGNVALLWRATDRLSLKITGLVEDINSADVEAVRLNLATRRPVLGDLRAAVMLAQPFRKTVQLYSATLKYDLEGYQLISASSWQSARTHVTTDSTELFSPLVSLLSGGAIASSLEPFTAELDFRKYTQEFRLATANSGRLEGMLGAFFTYEDALGNRQTLAALDSAGTAIPGLNPLFRANIPTTYQEEALFGNLTYKLTERFDVSAGLREAHNRQKYRATVSGSFLPGSDASSRSSESVFNYSVAARYRLAQDVMTYVRAATGYRPGGPNAPLNANIPLEYKADRIINYEVGVKSLLLDRRLELNVAGFQIDWRDVLLSLQDLSTGTNYQGNGKTARSRGVEWESIYRPSERLRLGLSATYTEAVLTQDLPPNSSVSGVAGDRLPSTPRFSGAATANYSFPLAANWSGSLGGIYHYVGSRYTGPSGSAQSLLLPSYSTMDLNLGAADASWSLNLFVRNLTNKRTYTGESLISDRFTLAPLAIAGTVLQPRTFGLSVDKRL